jgi:hypothetical protein
LYAMHSWVCIDTILHMEMIYIAIPWDLLECLD